MTGPRLYGRDAELAALAELIEQASERGSAIAVLGEAGTGKSTLLRAAVELARSAGFQVLQTAGVETEANLPYAGLHQLMRPCSTWPMPQTRCRRRSGGPCSPPSVTMRVQELSPS